VHDCNSYRVYAAGTPPWTLSTLPVLVPDCPSEAKRNAEVIRAVR